MFTYASITHDRSLNVFGMLCSQCDGCGISPIPGTRWHCSDCSKDNSVDFCTECLERLVLPYNTMRGNLVLSYVVTLVSIVHVFTLNFGAVVT